MKEALQRKVTIMNTREFLLQFRHPEPEFDLVSAVKEEARETEIIIGSDPLQSVDGMVDTVIKTLITAYDEQCGQ